VVVVNLAVGFAFLCLGIYMMTGALAMEYYTVLGPGPGFFPFWLAAIMSALTVLWLIRVLLGPKVPLPEGFFPNRRGALNIAAVLGALIFYAAFAELLGFRITMLAFLLFLLYVPGRQSVPMTLAIALLGSFGTYHLFHDLLDTHLPLASIGFLEDLGL